MKSMYEQIRSKYNVIRVRYKIIGLICDTNEWDLITK